MGSLRLCPRHLGIAATVVLVVIGLAIPIRNSYVERRLEGALERVAAWELELRSLDRSRPALYGATTEGEAWELYDQALVQLRAIEDSSARAPRALLARQPDEILARNALLVEAEPVLKTLREATHRRQGAQCIDWQRGFEAPIPKLLEVRALVDLAVAQGNLEFGRGASGRGVSSTLDALQFGRDLLGTPRLIDEMIGLAIMSVPIIDCLERRVWDKLELEDLQRLEHGLATLDEHLPPCQGRVLQGDVVLMTRSMQSRGFDLEGEWEQLDFSSWSHAFRPEVALAEYVDSLDEALASLAQIREAAHPKRQAEIEALAARFSDTSYPFSTSMRNAIKTQDRGWLPTLTKLRLLRLAVASATGSLLAVPRDPHGARLRFERHGERVRWVSPDDDSIFVEFDAEAR